MEASPTSQQVDGAVQPDAIKAAEVERMQHIEGKEWKHLMKRFTHGHAGLSSAKDTLKLILEVEDFMLRPLQQVFRRHRAGEGKPVIMLVGITGAGKSLTGNWLLGRRITQKRTSVAEPRQRRGMMGSMGVQSGDGSAATGKVELEIAGGGLLKVGSGHKSVTFAPNVQECEDFTLIDFPGICDTGGFEIRIGMDIAFRAIINELKNVHVLCLVPIESFKSGRGTDLLKQLEKFRRLLPLPGSHVCGKQRIPTSSSCSWAIGITKCGPGFVNDPASLFDEAFDFIQEWQPEFPEANIVNINEVMFAEQQDQVRNLVLSKICEQTHTPSVPLHAMEPLLQQAFGAGSRAHCIVSDCLTVHDTQILASIMRDSKFEATFFDNRDLGLDMNIDKDNCTWAEAKQALDAAVKKLKRLNGSLKQDSSNLIEHSRLALEAHDRDIADLCSKMQPGLKLAFLSGESNIIMRNTLDAVLLCKQLRELVRTLSNSKCLRPHHFQELVKKGDDVELALNSIVQDLGYKDPDDLLHNWKLFAGCAVAAGGGGIIIGTIAASTTIGVAAASGLAVAGLATGGIALAVGAAIGVTALVANIRNEGWSAEFKSTILEAFSELQSTVSVFAKHKTKLGGMEQKLQELVVLES